MRRIPHENDVLEHMLPHATTRVRRSTMNLAWRTARKIGHKLLFTRGIQLQDGVGEFMVAVASIIIFARAHPSPKMPA